VSRCLSSLSDFTALVLEKLQSIDKGSHDMVRLRRNLHFCPLLSDVQNFPDKRYFIDDLVIHALELDTESITGEELEIPASVQNRVLQDCGLDLQEATRLLRAHFERSDVLIRRDDISTVKSDIFSYTLHGRVLALFSRHHAQFTVQFKTFWDYLANHKNIDALSRMNKRAALCSVLPSARACCPCRSRKEPLSKSRQTPGQGGAKEAVRRRHAK
jgi:hypothetical protein